MRHCAATPVLDENRWIPACAKDKTALRAG